jgi:large subunit ribosomal protein L3
MVKGLLGKKLGMTRVFSKEGLAIDVTVLEAGPCAVVQRKTATKDGYDAVQLGFDEKREKSCTKPELGHFKKNGLTPKKALKEIRVEKDDPLKTGDTVKADIFAVGEFVDVSGVSKGKGYQSVIKRHGFSGGPGAHGSTSHRRPGSIGQSSTPHHVFKGMRMGGHMGSDKVTVVNLEVIQVDPEKNLLILRGSVPGATGGTVLVKKSVKGSK